MKSVRKVRTLDSAGLQTKTLSSHSLKSVGETVIEQNSTDSEWLPPKSLLIPPGQLTLTEKELNEEFIRILNANNPRAPQNIARFNHKEQIYKVSPNINHMVVHFEFDGYLEYKEEEGEEAIEVDKKNQKLLKNQFNFSERATQTLNPSHREKTSNTDPPPARIFSENVNLHTIHDAYIEDIIQKEKALVKDKKSSTTIAKGAKEDPKTQILPQESTQDVYYKNAELAKALTIIERMANLNTFDDIAQDYKYWEDAADEINSNKLGSLLPLWKFVCEKTKRKQVTSLHWSPDSPDLFAIGYGSYEFSKQGPGMMACFSLKNPSYPEYVFTTESGILCLDFHQQHSSMIVVGFYDGSVGVFDLKRKGNEPIFKSTHKHGKHSDPVWQVNWQKDDLDENLNFFSISADGRVTQWTLIKNELIHTDVIRLYMQDPPINEENKLLLGLASGQCFDFHKKIDHLFVVGTEEGGIHKCSKSYNNQYLLSFEGHQMAVHNLLYNPFNPDIFISCSADWTVKLWNHNQPKPLMTFDLYSPVGDIAWAPYSSSVFAACTADGKVFVFDLNENKNDPICEQQIVKKSKLTHVTFNSFEPILLVGDDKGSVVSLKLSPNLRRVGKSEEDQGEKLQRILVGSK